MSNSLTVNAIIKREKNKENSLLLGCRETGIILMLHCCPVCPDTLLIKLHSSHIQAVGVSLIICKVQKILSLMCFWLCGSVMMR